MAVGGAETAHLLLARDRRLESESYLLQFVLRLYAAPRAVVIDGITIITCNPIRSVVAGCTFADCMMMIVMLRVDSLIQQSYGSLCRCVLADDYQVLITAVKERIAQTVVSVLRCIF